jgi:hypothetical protein
VGLSQVIVVPGHFFLLVPSGRGTAAGEEIMIFSNVACAISNLWKTINKTPQPYIQHPNTSQVVVGNSFIQCAGEV